MHHRERGAAHINIYYFLVLLIGFLGALWFGYVQLSKVKGAEADRQAALEREVRLKFEKKIYVDYTAAITKAIGYADTWNHPDDADAWEGEMEADLRKIYGDQAYNNGKKTLEGFETSLKGVSEPGKVVSRLKNVAVSLSLPDSLANNLSKLMNDVVVTYNSAEQKAAAAVSAQKTALAAQATATQTYKQAEATARKKNDDNLANFQKQMNDYNERNNQLNTSIADEQSKYRDLVSEKSKMEDAHEVALTAKNKVISELDGQNTHLESVLAMKRPPQVEDGDVIQASMKARRAWVNIGRNKMLRPGTKFRITGPNGAKVKGHGTVRRVEQDRAELVITDIVAPIASPIVRGDKIWNDLYSPGLVRNIALIGRFSYPYSKPELKILLEKLGNKVHDEVKVGVDLVIVGLRAPATDGEGGLQPIEDLPGYKKAEKLRCEIQTLASIRDLLVIGD